MIIGPIRQEVLSGVSDEIQFKRLKGNLSALEDIQLKQEYFELAAEFCNSCRKKGIQGSSVDFLISSVAVSLDILVFTIDNDFKRYQKILPIKLL